MTRWASIDAAGADLRLSRSSLGGDNVVDQDPQALLAQSRRRMGPSWTLDDDALARVMSSERGDGPVAEQLAIGDADINRARRAGVSVFDHATGRTKRYGRQGKPRPVSTARDAYVRQGRMVQLLRGEARGIARGAIQYFDPRTQYLQWLAGRAVHPLVVLERWCFNKPWAGERARDSKGRQLAELGDAPKGTSGKLIWVGAIDGVDPWRTLLLRPCSSKNAAAAAELELVAARYAEVLEVLEVHLAPLVSAELAKESGA